jgi:hypothetical protein
VGRNVVGRASATSSPKQREGGVPAVLVVRQEATRLGVAQVRRRTAQPAKCSAKCADGPVDQRLVAEARFAEREPWRLRPSQGLTPAAARAIADAFWSTGRSFRRCASRVATWRATLRGAGPARRAGPWSTVNSSALVRRATAGVDWSSNAPFRYDMYPPGPKEERRPEGRLSPADVCVTRLDSD